MIEGFIDIEGQQPRAREQGSGAPILLTPVGPGWPAEQMVNLRPNATLDTLPEAGHSLWITHADTLQSVMLAFIDGQD